MYLKEIVGSSRVHLSQHFESLLNWECLSLSCSHSESHQNSLQEEQDVLTRLRWENSLNFETETQDKIMGKNAFLQRLVMDTE